MAWAADSNIAKGLLSTLEMLQKSDSSVIFITDGQEAPPDNPGYQADFSGLKGQAKGMIVGVGGLQAVPIPKFDSQGKQTGFYTRDEVPHSSSFGQSNLDPSQIKGYNARNAPFGNDNSARNEHLTALQESYLQALSAEAGLRYQRLTDVEALAMALQIPEFAGQRLAAVDVRWQMALAALALVVLVYAPMVCKPILTMK
jgi:mxaL protein